MQVGSEVIETAENNRHSLYLELSTYDYMGDSAFVARGWVGPYALTGWSPPATCGQFNRNLALPPVSSGQLVQTSPHWCRETKL